MWWGTLLDKLGISFPGLPVGYPDSWKKYGLFSHSGMDTILGKGKKDFSTLMTLASANRFLRMQGKMAFPCTQSVFKSEGRLKDFGALVFRAG